MSRSALALVLLGCAGGGPSIPAPHATRHDESSLPTVANISYPDLPGNLIVNGDFEDYPDANVPDGWTIDEIYRYRGMYAPTDGWLGLGVQLTRNAQGRHLLAQTVAVEPHHLYTAQLVYEVTATDSRHGGLYVVDPTDGSSLGSDTINRPSNGWRIATVTFDSGERSQVTVELGYAAGMNGTAIYDGVRMFDATGDYAYRYQTSYRDTIGIPAMPTGDLVPLLSDYVTGLLAASRADRLAHRDAHHAELPYYLDLFLTAPDGQGARASWCQRTALALGELLAMYGVPTRQVHASPIQHEFLEYFDAGRWIVFDPYYGIRYVLNGQRLGVDAIVSAGLDQVSIDVPTQNHVFLLELGYLRPIWSSGSFALGIDM